MEAKMSDEQMIKGMVERYRKWDAKGTPDPVIMNKILANIKPIIFKAGQDSVFDSMPENLPPLLETAYRTGFNKVVEWIECNVNWRHDAPYKSTIDMHDWQAFLKGEKCVGY